MELGTRMANVMITIMLNHAITMGEIVVERMLLDNFVLTVVAKVIMNTHMDISQGPIAILWSKIAFFQRKKCSHALEFQNSYHRLYL